jgi:hypothetical protein
MYLGDSAQDKTVRLLFHTSVNGVPTAPSSALEAADFKIYKNGGAAQKTTTNGITVTSPFDGITGCHLIEIDTSNDTGDAGFWVGAADYVVVLDADETLDGSALGGVIGEFSIENRSALRPTVADRTLDVSAGGEAGIDWANIGSPTTAVNLSATNIDTDQVVASVTGAVGSVTGAVGSVTGNVGGNVAGSVASVTAGVTLAASATQAIWDALTSALTTAGSIGKLLVDNINATISSRLASSSYTAPLDAAGTRSAVGLASANLDTQLDAIPTAAENASQVRTELTTELGRVDAAISTRATPAQVNTEVLDVLVTDTFAEPAAVPAATSSLKDKIGWLFTLGRNKVTQTSATQAVRNDADSANIATATVADDGTTFTRGEWT